VTLNNREGWEGGEEEQHSRGHHHQALTDAIDEDADKGNQHHLQSGSGDRGDKGSRGW